MNVKPCLNYNPNKTHGTYKAGLDARIAQVRKDKALDDETMSEIVTCILYASIYTIPAYLLDKERKVTFEEICVHCINIFKFTLHDLLEAGSSFITRKDTTGLKTVLSDVFFRETCVYINLDSRSILTVCAFYITKDETLLEMYESGSSFEEILFYFEEG